MHELGHRRVTELAFLLLSEKYPSFPLLESKGIVAQESVNTDSRKDLELVDVEGGYSNARDNPHKDEPGAIDDKPHYRKEGHFFTAFNHFIDIKKGPGAFDDFDGYSYYHGSASIDEYESASEAEEGSSLAGVLVTILEHLPFAPTICVDWALNYWLNDEYVHAPGQDWYEACSPCIEWYSYYADRGVYGSVEAEAKRRFPLAESTGRENKGVPYSVFMPVDNMARYWFSRYCAERTPECLGPVMHAIQDASVPHHAAGYNGNWHQRYENELDRKISIWQGDSAFLSDIRAFFDKWMKEDEDPPLLLNEDDWSKTPSINWRIDMLVTWLAINAYHAYTSVYDNFRQGYSRNDASMKTLAEKAVAISMLGICKTIDYHPRPTVSVPDESWLWVILG